MNKYKTSEVDFFTFLDYFFLTKHDKDWSELSDNTKMDYAIPLKRTLAKGNPIKIDRLNKFITPLLIDAIREDYKIRGNRKPQFVYRKFTRKQQEKNVKKVAIAIDTYARKYNTCRAMVIDYITTFPDIVMPELESMVKDIKAIK